MFFSWEFWAERQSLAVSGTAHSSTPETIQTLVDIPETALLSTLPTTQRCPHILLKSSFA